MFINRKPEMTFLRGAVKLEQRRSKLIILAGPSGVGKSLLVEHCLAEQDDRKFFSVRIENHLRNVDDDRLFLTRLAGSIITEAQGDRDLPDLPSVLRQLRAPKSFQSFCAALADHFGRKFIGDDAYDVLSDLANAVVTGGARLPEVVTPELELYIQYVVSAIPSIIRLENAQILDRRSFDFFLNLFADSTNLLGIFEITTGADWPSNMSVEELRRCFDERHVDVQCIELERLNLEEIVYELKDQPDELIRMLKRSYALSDGNLHPLHQLAVYTAKGWKKTNLGQIGYDEVANILTTDLPRAERQLLVAVAVHGGSVNLDVLRAFFANEQTSATLALVNFDLDGALQGLDGRLFLALNANFARTCHDSIIKVVEEAPATRGMSLVLEKAWREFYSEIYNRGGDFFVPLSEALDWLTFFNARLQDATQLLRCLEDIGRHSFESVSPRRLLDYLRKLRDKLVRLGSDHTQSTLDALFRQQAFLLYEAGWADEALEYITQVGQPDLASSLLHADLLCSIDRYDEGMDLAEKLKNRATPNANLCIDLIRMHGLRMAGRLEDCRNLYLKMIGSVGIECSPLYPTVLRFADLALYRDEDQKRCLEFLETSVELCLRLGLKRDEAVARMALVQQLGYTEKLERIESHLDAIELAATQVWVQRYAVINNRAVLDVYRQRCGETTLRHLSQALVLCSEFHDRLIVKNNQLIAFCISEKEDWTDRLLSELMMVVDGRYYVEAEIRKICLYNIARALKRLGRHNETEAYWKQIRAINTGLDQEFWDTVLNDERPPGNAPRYRLDFYPIFISHWPLSSSAIQCVEQ